MASAEAEALSDTLRAAYVAAWADVVAEQETIALDPRQFRRRARLREVQEGIERRMTQLDEFTRAWLSEQLPIVYRLGAAEAGRILGEAFQWTTTDQGAVATLAQESLTTLLEATQHVRESTKALIRSLARESALSGLLRGDTATESGRRLARLLDRNLISAVIYRDGSRHGLAEYADMVIRTTTANAYNRAAVSMGRRMGVRFMECFDGADCGLSSHQDSEKPNGKVYPIEVAATYSIAHPRCVPAGTRVSALGDVLAVYKAQYTGGYVVIRTAGGSRLTITPNHPVLTGRGWIAAQFVQEGDQVVRGTGQVRGSNLRPTPSEGYLNKVPSLVEQIFDTCWSGGANATAVTAPDDFHGDAEGFVGEVHVVCPDGSLASDDHSPIPEEPIQPVLMGTGVVHPDGVRAGSLFSSPLWLRDASTSPGSGPARFHVPGVGILVTDDNPSFLHPLTETTIADADLCRRLFRRHPCDISLDRVVEIRYLHPDSTRRHVFDLSTTDNAYFADGILVHNCQRSWSPRPDVLSKEAASQARSSTTAAQREDQAESERTRAQASRERAARRARQRRAAARAAL